MRKYIFILSLFLFWPLNSFGATSEPFLYLTWKAKSYVPNDYLGKILPGASSPILVSLEAFENGKVADISNSQIKWYVDGELSATTVGKKSFDLRTSHSPSSGVILVRANITNKWDRQYSKEVSIPVSPPVVILKSNYLSRSFGDNKISISAYPYFFGTNSLSDLIFAWKVNGQPVNSAENPQIIDVSFNKDADPGSTITVEGAVSNPSGVRESAFKREIFKYIP